MEHKYSFPEFLSHAQATYQKAQAEGFKGFYGAKEKFNAHLASLYPFYSNSRPEGIFSNPLHKRLENLNTKQLGAFTVSCLDFYRQLLINYWLRVFPADAQVSPDDYLESVLAKIDTAFANFQGKVELNPEQKKHFFTFLTKSFKDLGMQEEEFLPLVEEGRKKSFLSAEEDSALLASSTNPAYDKSNFSASPLNISPLEAFSSHLAVIKHALHPYLEDYSDTILEVADNYFASLGEEEEEGQEEEQEQGQGQDYLKAKAHKLQSSLRKEALAQSKALSEELFQAYQDRESSSEELDSSALEAFDALFREEDIKFFFTLGTYLYDLLSGPDLNPRQIIEELNPSLTRSLLAKEISEEDASALEYELYLLNYFINNPYKVQLEGYGDYLLANLLPQALAEGVNLYQKEIERRQEEAQAIAELYQETFYALAENLYHLAYQAPQLEQYQELLALDNAPLLARDFYFSKNGSQVNSEKADKEASSVAKEANNGANESADNLSPYQSLLLQGFKTKISELSLYAEEALAGRGLRYFQHAASLCKILPREDEENEGLLAPNTLADKFALLNLEVQESKKEENSSLVLDFKAKLATEFEESIVSTVSSVSTESEESTESKDSLDCLDNLNSLNSSTSSLDSVFANALSALGFRESAQANLFSASTNYQERVSQEAYQEALAELSQEATLYQEKLLAQTENLSSSTRSEEEKKEEEKEKEKDNLRRQTIFYSLLGASQEGGFTFSEVFFANREVTVPGLISQGELASFSATKLAQIHYIEDNLASLAQPLLTLSFPYKSLSYADFNPSFCETFFSEKGFMEFFLKEVAKDLEIDDCQVEESVQLALASATSETPVKISGLDFWVKYNQGPQWMLHFFLKSLSDFNLLAQRLGKFINYDVDKKDMLPLAQLASLFPLYFLRNAFETAYGLEVTNQDLKTMPAVVALLDYQWQLYRYLESGDAEILSAHHDDFSNTNHNSFSKAKAAFTSKEGKFRTDKSKNSNSKNNNSKNSQRGKEGKKGNFNPKEVAKARDAIKFPYALAKQYRKHADRNFFRQLFLREDHSAQAMKEALAQLTSKK